MNLQIIENGDIVIDVSRLHLYLAKIKDIPSISIYSAPGYIRDFIVAYDITSTFLARVTEKEILLKNLIDKLESIAYLEKAPEYLAQRNIKDTSASRDRYVDMDDEVVAVKDKYAKIVALSSFLKNKLVTFKAAHDDVKKIIYKDTFTTPEEGFNGN